MTAEIAILNRIGVAMAADSAVTISSNNGTPKTYDSADKLFELSGGEPVGIMIHGSAEFMGIPAETIVKGFCGSPYNTPQPELAGYARKFFEYMRHELPVESGATMARIANVAVNAFAGIRAEAESDYESLLAKGSRAKPAIFMAKRIQEIASAHVKTLRRQERIEGLSDKNLPPDLDDITAQAIETVLGDGLLAKAEVFEEMIRLILLTKVRTQSEIGFVFAGFGTSQIFPAIEAFDCDMSLVDALRIVPRGGSQISSAQVAIIRPFAQSEMVERFMDGVDTSYNQFIREALRGALTNFGNEVAKRLGAESMSRSLVKELEGLRDDYLTELDQLALEYRAGAYRHNILEVVQFMPRLELAEMAESLVNLTSIKRRVSAEHQSVGGPIDVAFVSKYDGFTWVRRKGVAARPHRPPLGVGPTQGRW